MLPRAAALRTPLVRAFCSRSAEEEFEPVVRAFYGTMDAGLQNMVETNAGSMTVSIDGDRMDVDVGESGTFMFQANYSERELTVLSPVSGVNTYAYDSGRTQFSSTADEHNLLELFTRDIMSVAAGYPTF